MKLNNFRDLKPELIIWEDVTDSSDAWNDEKDVQEWLSDEGEGLCETLGFVIGEDDKSLVIASTIMESAKVYSVVTKIPKSLVQQRLKWGETKE